MRNTDRWKAGNRPAAFTIELGDWQRFEPDAIDKRERLMKAFEARLRRGQKIEPAPVRALLEGIAGAAEAAEAVEAANAERAAAIGKGLSR